MASLNHLPRVVRACLAVQLLMLPFIVAAVAGWIDEPLRDAIVGPWYVLIGATAASVSVGMFVRKHGDEGKPWRWVFAAGVCAALANALGLLLGIEPGFSPLALLLVLIYPCIYVGLTLMLRSRVVRIGALALLDGLSGAAAMFALAAALVIPYVLAQGHADEATAVSQVAYPLFNAVTSALLITLWAACGWRPGRPIVLISLALIAFAANNVGYLMHLSATGEIRWAASAILVWLAVALLTLAPWSGQLAPARAGSGTGALLVLPVAFQVVAVGVLGAAAFTELPRSAITAAWISVLLTAGRFILTILQLTRLPEALREARTDELTGLANRRALYAALNERFAKSPGEPVAVLLLDIDRFKQINDTLGHNAGDELLAHLASRLARRMRPGDLLARVGGDEFALLCPSAGIEDGRRIAARVLEGLEDPFVVGGIAMHADASIGVAAAPGHGETAEELLRHADVAMYLAKSGGNSVVVYDEQRDVHSRDRLSLRSELRSALSGRRGLLLHYQPQVNLRTGQADGVEALVRWHHPDRGLLPPAAFLPGTDDPRACRDLTARVLEMAVADVQTWRAQGLMIRVAVNMSALDLVEGDLAGRVAELLDSTGLPGDVLKIELTETALMEHPDRAAETLRRLRELGCTASLDDFGTGYSALSLLARLPLDEVKIDRSFVQGLRRHQADEAVVRAAVGLGRDLGLEVVAEGAEDEETVARITALGCTHVQGFAVARPMPARELTEYLSGGVSLSAVRQDPG